MVGLAKLPLFCLCPKDVKESQDTVGIRTGDRGQEGNGRRDEQKAPPFSFAPASGSWPLPKHLPPHSLDRPYCVDDGPTNAVRMACLSIPPFLDRSFSLDLCLPTALLCQLVSFIKQSPGGPSA